MVNEGERGETVRAIYWLLIPLTIVSTGAENVAKAAARSLSFYGVEMDQPLALRMCGQPRQTAGLCVTEAPAASNAAAGMKYFVVNFPAGQAPSFVKGVSFQAGVLDGKVADVRIVTTGFRSEVEVIGDLIGKLGEPSFLSEHRLLDEKGAEMRLITALWKTDRYDVDFEAFSEDLNTGLITAETAAGAAYLAKQRR